MRNESLQSGGGGDCHRGEKDVSAGLSDRQQWGWSSSRSEDDGDGFDLGVCACVCVGGASEQQGALNVHSLFKEVQPGAGVCRHLLTQLWQHCIVGIV